jgi:hypothetical protein
VDLVINGHNHIYERNNPLINGTQTSTAPIGSTITPATQGTTYVVAGGAGQLRTWTFTCGGRAPTLPTRILIDSGARVIPALACDPAAVPCTTWGFSRL